MSYHDKSMWDCSGGKYHCRDNQDNGLFCYNEEDNI